MARWEGFWRTDTLPRHVGGIGARRQPRGLLEIVRGETPSNPVMQRAVPAAGRCLLRRSARQPDPAAALNEIREAARVQGGGGKKAWSSEEMYAGVQEGRRGPPQADREGPRPGGLRPGRGTTGRRNGPPPARAGRGVGRGSTSSEKRELAALDFDDLLIRARDLLVGPHARRLAAAAGRPDPAAAGR